MDIHAVNPVLMCTLSIPRMIISIKPLSQDRKSMLHTCGGPKMVPFQFDIIMSSPSASPYEHASGKVSVSRRQV